MILGQRFRGGNTTVGNSKGRASGKENALIVGQSVGPIERPQVQPGAERDFLPQLEIDAELPGAFALAN